MTKKTEREIENQIDKANAWVNAGDTDVPGMSYEEGVKAALEWALGILEDAEPIENEYEEE